MTVIPATSPLFTLPSADNPSEALPYADLPLYEQDYIGLKALDEAGGLHHASCNGQHMEIDEECWSTVIRWLGRSGEGRGPRVRGEGALVAMRAGSRSRLLVQSST